ncbi:alpha/beta hydrolase [Phanerochaete sordida]|uniref:Alpha/beta hydrolase n=1 Tax=Phanerochaete sordida TaxID=48140 RepID=A0A9P3G626_9APHY|nr:alpha/beta hydrolase [Phanerochaete sordida]
MICDSFVFDPRPDYQFRLAVKRYRHRVCHNTDDDALTLIFAHCVGGHKEQWELTLDYLFDAASRHPSFKIREAWSIDAPEHGDSAILNDHLLTSAMDWRPESSWCWENSARCTHMFLSGLGHGVDVDFRTRRLVVVGHSLGGITSVLSTVYYPRVDFAAMLLIEPMIIRKPKPGESNLEFSESIAKRKDVWDSPEAAFRYFSSSLQWKSWDPRALKIYAEHALRTLPTETYPDRNTGVTLKCPRRLEAALYRERLCSLRAFEYLQVLCQRIPVHIILGEHADFIPRSFLQDIPTLGTRGHHASLRFVPGAGHLLVQTHPEATAEAIAAALEHDGARSNVAEKGKLAKL